MIRRFGLFAVLSFAVLALPLPSQAQEGDAAVLAVMQDVNTQLRSMGLKLAVEQIEFFTIGLGRPSNRIHQQPFRWVPNDPRRAADGTNFTQSERRGHRERFDRGPDRISIFLRHLWPSQVASAVSSAARQTG